MKKLPTPQVDDGAVSLATAQNQKLHRTSYPHFSNALPAILAAYGNYDQQNGNALNIAPIPVSDNLKRGLLANYRSPPVSLSYIKDLRTASPDVCPMCGSLGTQSLDHLCPQDDYPEYAVYSRNLVPACHCNMKRGTTLKDPAKGVRVLHPYYDECLVHRQLSCSIAEVPKFPHVKITVQYVDPNGPHIDSVRFHCEKVVKPSGLIVWLESQWASLDTVPYNIIHTLPRRRLTDVEFRSHSTDALTRHDEAHGTPNNWPSIFLHGVLNSQGVVSWILQRHNASIARTTANI